MGLEAVRSGSFANAVFNRGAFAKRMRVGIIGGTGLRRLAPDLEEVSVATAWGDATVFEGDLRGVHVAFVPRHGAAHNVPAHRLPHRRHMAALAARGADAVLAVNNTGALHPSLPMGSAVVPDDLIDLTGRIWTMFEEEVVHVEFSQPYCPHLRGAILAGLEGVAWPDAQDGGVYVQSNGPRLETRAEVRELARMGDVVGMTGAPEATLAREAGMCYASLCFIANHAAGVVETKASAQEIEQAMADAAPRVAEVLAGAVGQVDDGRDCACRTAPKAGRLS